MERASRNIKNGASMAGSFVGQRGPREQMRIGEEEDVGRKKGDEERRERERETVQESETQYLLPSSPPPTFLFSMHQTPLVVRLVSTGEIRRSVRIDFNKKSKSV